ncbi:hypothetical protein HOD61_01955 [archaeon]|jgi:hypothetical protein|nr:hypothetical protein [archaeon]
MVGKKGLFTLYVLMYAVLGIGVSMFLFVDYHENIRIEYLGNSQLELIDAYTLAEKDFFFVDYSFKSANSLRYLLERGGSSSLSHNKDFNLWKVGNLECYPTKEMLKKEFSALLNNLTNINYSFTYEDKENSFFVLAHSSDKLNYDILDNGTKIGTYSISPDVYFEVDYNFDDFVNFVGEVVTVIDSCDGDISCWETSAEFEWEFKEDVFIFSSKEYAVDSIQGTEQIKIRAAVDFDELNPLQGEVFICNN